MEEDILTKLHKLAEDERLTVSSALDKIVDAYSEMVAEERKGASNGSRRRQKSRMELSGIAWNETTGTLTLSPSDNRLFLMSSHAWALLEEALFLNLLKGASTLIFEMGRAYGRALAIELVAASKDSGSIGDHFERVCRLMGWGRVAVEGDLVKGQKITFKVDNCLFCGNRSSTAIGRDSCYFFMGVAKGFADTVVDWPHSVREKNCRLRGDENCEFIVESKQEFDSKESKWGLRVYFPNLYTMKPGF